MAGSDRSLAGVPALVAALVGGSTLTEAAAAAGMSERTARRRWADPTLDLARQVDDARTEAFAATTAALGEAAREAVTGLRDLAANSPNDAVRVRAYGLLLAESRSHREIHDLQKRLEDIEARLDADNLRRTA